MSQNWVIQVVILPGQFQDLVSVAGWVSRQFVKKIYL